MDSLDEKIIDFVKQRPFLYDKKQMDYKDSAKKLNAWSSFVEKINKECGRTFLGKFLCYFS
jgi:hypothetical protein